MWVEMITFESSLWEAGPKANLCSCTILPVCVWHFYVIYSLHTFLQLICSQHFLLGFFGICLPNTLFRVSCFLQFLMLILFLPRYFFLYLYASYVLHNLFLSWSHWSHTHRKTYALCLAYYRSIAKCLHMFIAGIISTCSDLSFRKAKINYLVINALWCRGIKGFHFD